MHAEYILLETMAKERQERLLKEAEIMKLSRLAGPTRRGIIKWVIIGLANLLIFAGHRMKAHCDPMIASKIKNHGPCDRTICV